MILKSISVALFLFAALQSAVAEEVVKSLEAHYGGVNFDTIQQSVADAAAHLQANPDDTYIIEIPAGTHHVAPPETSLRIFDFSGIKPDPEGRLIIRGAGMDETTISIPVDASHIIGRHSYHITISDIHFTRDVRQSTTQGHVVAIGTDSITLDIQSGFPAPDAVYDPDRVHGVGRYMRRYVGSPERPRVDQHGNEQIAWTEVSHLGGSLWKFTVTHVSRLASYSVGDLVGIKQKHGGEPYRFVIGDDIRFERVRWSAESRGIFINVNHPAVVNCRVEPGPAINGQVSALSTNGGGPQIHGRDGFTVHGVLIAGNVFVGTGDDAIGLFNVRDGVVSGNNIVDSFARGILLLNSAAVVLSANRIIRSPVEYRSN